MARKSPGENDKPDSLAAALRSVSVRLMDLAELADGQVAISEATDFATSAETKSLLSIARAVFNARRKRDAFVPAHLLGEPAWDVLLDLFIQNERGTKVSIKGACIASNVPFTTALRCLGSLEDSGLVERYATRQDKRVRFVRLTKSGNLAILGWLRYRVALSG